MIYRGNVYDLSEVTKAFRKIGISENAVAVFNEYMDVSKERNNEALRRLNLSDYNYEEVKKASNYMYYLWDVIESHIFKKDTELSTRYILFSYALAGCRCEPLLRFYIHHDSDGSKYLIPAFRELTDDESKKDTTAKAVWLAIQAEHSLLSNIAKVSSEEYLAAAIIAAVNSPATALKLVIAALNLCETGKNTPFTEKCVELIRSICRTNKGDINIMPLLSTAYGTAAYYDDEFRKLFREEMKEFPDLLLENTRGLGIDMKPLYALVETEKIAVTQKYILTAMNMSRGNYVPIIKPHLKYLAENYERSFVNAMNELTDARQAKNILNILIEANPKYSEENDGGLRKNQKLKLINAVYRRTGSCKEAREYLLGQKSLSEISDALKNTRYNYSTSLDQHYALAYGIDETVRRCVAVSVFSNFDSWGINYDISSISGLSPARNDEGRGVAEILMTENVPVYKILMLELKPDHLVPYADRIAEADFKSLTAEARCLYIRVLYMAAPDKYRDKLFAAADDTSKAVRAVLTEVVPKIPDCKKDIEEMLSAKKAAKRETALEIIRNMPELDWAEILEASLEKEKSDKLRVKITSLLGAEKTGGEAKSELSAAQLAEELTRGNKPRKVAWLFQSPYRPVHFTSGEEAAEKYMQAVLLCYASGDNVSGKTLCEALNVGETAVFAAEVMGRWLDSGAAAKEKWVLVFAALWGGKEIIDVFVHYIKYWSENMRGAMAVAAVKALALNGSSEALMQVDSFARKFKSNQVKAAANEAMAEAAEFLGITTEELADRIVPDMGFDDKMCRTFDYGTRKFSIYLTPSLEIEIYNGEKKVKNLPKPGVNDDTETAEKSYAEFKEMKKQLKNVVSVQKARLEYALMCERKWTSEGWEKLFVKNPVMHSFAIGLIWGVYEDGELKNTFRYMDDGSFTTSDEDEFELPKNAVISLVHPIELTDEEIASWSEQLSDYEIAQPFPQLARTVYRPDDKELENTEIVRFKGRTIVNLTLMSRLLKKGWYKGTAQDAGFFYEFTRKDVSRRIKNEKGISVPDGWGAELKFSGMYIGAYSEEAEDVTVEELVFYKAADMNSAIHVKDVNKRYFSEIIMQLTEILG